MLPTPPSGQSGLLRELNDRAALTLLLDSGALTRNELAQRTGLSKPTAAEILRRLEALDMIRDSGSRSGRRGPSAALYEAVTARDRGVAIDVQHDRVLSVVVDASRNEYPVADRRFRPGAASDAATLITSSINAAAMAAHVDPDDIVSVCVGVQASVNHATDSLSFSEDLIGWPASRVAESLADEIGVRVALENDANLAAIAECAAPSSNPLSSFALFWLAEGLGTALVIDGKLHSGATGAAGELGYLGVPAAALALDKSAEAVADLVDDSAIIRLAKEHSLLDPAKRDSEWHTVLDAIRTLDERHAFFSDLAERIGHSLLPALAVADPEAVILHGPTGVAGGPALASAVTAWLRTRTRWVAPVLPARVPTEAVLCGARQMLVEEIRLALTSRLSVHTEAASASTSHSFDPTRDSSR